MRIAMIGQKGIPSRSGGVEIHVEELSKRLVRLGHSVTVYCRKTYCNEMKLKHEGIRLIYIPSINTKHLDAIIYTILATLHALLQGFDIFHFHALGPATTAILPRLLGKKVVCTIHGLDWQRDKWGGFAKKYLQFGELCIAKFAHTAISVSESLIPYFRQKYQKELVYIPNGVNIPEGKPPNLITRQYGLKKNGYLLYLGRLVPEKGIHYLIDAYMRLNPNMKLVIAGGSSHTKDYEKQLRMMSDGHENILFTGFVKGRLLEELFSNAFLYILPSDLEGMPISLLEAMSYGQVCLVSDIAENRAVVWKNGFYFSKGNPNSLYKMLKQLIFSGQSLLKYKKAAVNYVRNNFCWDEVVANHDRIYNQLAKTGKHMAYAFNKTDKT